MLIAITQAVDRLASLFQLSPKSNVNEAAHGPTSNSIRVLEIGAGTGKFTSCMVRASSPFHDSLYAVWVTSVCLW